MLEDGSTVIREGEGAVPLGTGCKDEEVVVNAFARGQDDRAVFAFFALLDAGDATDLDGAVALDEETVVGDEHGLFELVLGGGRHADGGGEVERKRAGGHEGERGRVGVDFGGEDACDGCAGCATTDDYDALTAGLGHGMEWMDRGEKCRRFGVGEDCVGDSTTCCHLYNKGDNAEGGLLLFADITERMLKALIHVRGVIALTHRLLDLVTFM